MLHDTPLLVSRKHLPATLTMHPTTGGKQVARQRRATVAGIPDQVQCQQQTLSDEQSACEECVALRRLLEEPQTSAALHSQCSPAWPTASLAASRQLPPRALA